MTDQNRLAALAAEAVAHDHAMKDEIADERVAKAGLLVALVLAVRPSLPAICSKVPCFAMGKASEYGRRVSRWMAEDGPFGRAVLVGGSERPEPPAKKIEGVEPLVGSGLYLSEAGTFFSVKFEGSFRNASAASLDDYWWEASATELSPSDVVQERWAVDRIVEALAAELEVQVEGKAKASEKARRTAARIREVASLLKGIR